MKTLSKFYLGFITYSLLAALQAHSQSSISGQVQESKGKSLKAQEPYVIPRFEGSFRLDGIIDEAGWQSIESLPVAMHIPTVGESPTERTEFRIAYDDDFLYVAGFMYDDPKGVQGYSFKRDDGAGNADWFGINLDTFRDSENCLSFFTLPTGNRYDFNISNDAQGDNWINFSWNTFWDVAVHRNSKGWVAEFKIPFSSLRYQDQEGRVVMGLTVVRRIARKNEMITYPLISNEWGDRSIWKASQTREIVFEQLYSKKPIYITPYLLGGVDQINNLNETQTGYEQIMQPAYDAGLDIKYGLTSNLTLDLTFNTDFAQVEADDQQVNLTRFSLFFPEKRLFFQERASVFAFDLGTPNQLFYSRRIGLHNGEQVRILGGVRLVGRVRKWDVGLIDMQTDADAGLPSENLGVLRLRRQVINENSYVGLMTTSRIDVHGQYNLAYGLDGIFRVFGQDFLRVNWAQTFDRGQGDRLNSLDASRIRLQWERRTIKGIGYDISFSRAGEYYNPGLGFEFRHDYSRFGDRIFYGWIPKKESGILNHQLGLYGYVFLHNQDGTTQSVELAPTWDVSFKSNAYMQAKLRYSYESLPDTFHLSEEAFLPTDNYQFYALSGFYQTPQVKILNTRIDVDAGSFYDGKRLSLGFTPKWTVSRFLELSGFIQWNKVILPERQQAYTATITRLRTKASLNVKLSAEAFVQYNSAANAISTNLRFRYNPREGNDLYLVFNQGNNTYRFRTVPDLPLISGRTIVVKYTYTFVW